MRIKAIRNKNYNSLSYSLEFTNYLFILNDMREQHEILCPPVSGCEICDQQREESNLQKILELIGNNSVAIMNKHFYCLTISMKPTRETYHRFGLEPILKVGRELINGSSSLSGVTNREWWSSNVDAGVRFYSVRQDSGDDYPIFNIQFIFYSSKDNLVSASLFFVPFKS